MHAYKFVGNIQIFMCLYAKYWKRRGKWERREERISQQESCPFPDERVEVQALAASEDVELKRRALFFHHLLILFMCLV